MRVKTTMRQMKEAKVAFISLVTRGANRIPFRVLKSDKGEDNMLDLTESPLVAERINWTAPRIQGRSARPVQAHRPRVRSNPPWREARAADRGEGGTPPAINCKGSARAINCKTEPAAAAPASGRGTPAARACTESTPTGHASTAPRREHPQSARQTLPRYRHPQGVAG